MSSVSQIITFRKGRAFTTHRPEPPVAPAPPPVPSATVTLGGDADKRKLDGATYTQQVQKAIKIEFGSRPTDVKQAQAEAAEKAEKAARAERDDEAQRAEKAARAKAEQQAEAKPPAPPPPPPAKAEDPRPDTPRR